MSLIGQVLFYNKWRENRRKPAATEVRLKKAVQTVMAVAIGSK